MNQLTTDHPLLEPLEIFRDSASHLQPTDWLIENLLTTQSFAGLIGAPASGKSFVALDLALSIASGRPYHGNPVKQGPVLYLAGEGVSGLQKRAAAWCLMNNQSTNNNLLIHRGGMDLANPHYLEAYANALEETLEDSPSLIVVDTLARYAISADENNNTDISKFIESIAHHLQRRFDSTILVVHHTAKHGSSARGASALLGALDFEYRVKKLPADPMFDGMCVELSNTKTKDSESAPTMIFELDKQDLVLSCGIVETSLVPRLRSTTTTTTSDELCLSGAVQTLYDVLTHGSSTLTRLQVREIYIERGLNVTNLTKQIKALTLELYRVNPDVHVDKTLDPWAVLMALMVQRPQTQTQQITDI